MSKDSFQHHRNSSAIIKSESTSSSSESLTESESFEDSNTSHQATQDESVVVVNPILEDTVDDLNTGLSESYHVNNISMIDLENNMEDQTTQGSAMDDQHSFMLAGTGHQESNLLKSLSSSAAALGGATANPKGAGAEAEVASVENSLNSGKFYPERDQCTEKDSEILNKLRWPMTEISVASKRQLQKLDYKDPGTRLIFRALNDNPDDFGYDEKNLTDLLVNPVTLSKACRVGCKEKDIDQLFEKVDKSLAQANKLTEAATNALSAANACKESLTECKNIIKNHMIQVGQKFTSLENRVENLEKAGSPSDIVKDITETEARAVEELVAESKVVKTLRKQHAKNTVTIYSNQKKINNMVDKRGKERLNTFELRILEFNPDPVLHGFQGDFLKAGETKYKEIVNKILKEVWEKYDTDDTRTVRAYKCLETKIGVGDVSWQPYRFTVIFDTAAAADKIYARARLLKNGRGGLKHVIVRPKTGEQIDRERDLKEQLLSKNLRRAPDEMDQSYVTVRLKDGSRGLILKKNQDLQQWQIFNPDEHSQTAKNKAIQRGIEEDKKMQEIDNHTTLYQLGQEVIE